MPANMVRLASFARTFCATTALVLLCSLSGVPARGQTLDPGDFFESKIRPVLSSRCYSCHTGLKSGGLQLDSRQNILKGGIDGPVVVPGHPEDSLLIKAISHTHERIKMPLNGPKLDDETIENFKKWVRDGVAWPESAEEFFGGRVPPVL